MKKVELKELEDFLCVVLEIRFLNWGSEIHLVCIDDPIDRHEYLVVFKQCKQLNWQVHELSSSRDVEAELIESSIGESNYKKPATIITDIFDFSVLYNQVEVFRL